MLTPDQIAAHDFHEQRMAALPGRKVRVMGVTLDEDFFVQAVRQGGWTCRLTVLGWRLWRISPEKAFRWWGGRLIGSALCSD